MSDFFDDLQKRASSSPIPELAFPPKPPEPPAATDVVPSNKPKKEDNKSKAAEPQVLTVELPHYNIYRYRLFARKVAFCTRFLVANKKLRPALYHHPRLQRPAIDVISKAHLCQIIRNTDMDLDWETTPSGFTIYPL